MQEAMRQFSEKFRVEDLKIAENDTWIWSVRPLQCMLGASILSTKTYRERLSELSLEEGNDLIRIVRVIEATLHRTFRYNKINYLMLMMVDLNVHYHVLPRYSGQTTFAGITWTDPGWPALPILKGGEIAEEVLLAIRDALRRNAA